MIIAELAARAIRAGKKVLSRNLALNYEQLRIVISAWEEITFISTRLVQSIIQM
jgi:hypothetical protein